MRLLIAAAVAALSVASPTLAAPKDQAAAAAPVDAAQAAKEAKANEVARTLKFQHGVITVPGTDAKLNLSDRYSFLDAADAKKVLIDIWGNRPEEQNDVLGMIVPAHLGKDESMWGAVITWQGDGYVSDKDAKKINYVDTLKQMQDGEADINEQRTKQGFPTMHVAGWAEPPAYDPATHTMIWARDLKIGDDPDHGLNYDLRILGRKGVLSLNMIAGMKDLQAVKAASADVRQTAQFDPGARYGDFKQGDHMAAYGLAGLLAAGVGLAVAKKIGVIAVLLLFLKKFAVVILAAFGGVGAWISRQWRRMTGRGPDPSDAPPPRQPPLDMPPPSDGAV